MKESRKQLLKMIYDYDQTEGKPLQVPCDGTGTPFEPETLKSDVSYLKRNNFVCEPMPILRSYVLALTEKGEQFVENGFQLPSEVQTTNFNFGNANVSNAIIGNQASGNEFTLNSQTSLSELQKLIQTKPVADQEQLDQLLALLQSLEQSKEPIPRGFFAKVSDLIKKHTDLIVPIGNALVSILFRAN